MANMAMEKTPMPEQAADIRNKNFEEVTLGYTEEMAVNEAKRCLNCKNMPCVQGCPVNIHIPEFISKVAESDFAGAYKVITKTNALPAISGRVCPQETQCEMHCVRGIKGEPVAIGRLERFVADWYRANVNEDVVKPESNGIKVAVVGSGPSSLTCASDLAMAGYQVTIFEAFHTAGGVLVYGIPEFRLPKAIVQHEVDGLSAHGVEIKTDMVIGKVLTIDELFEMDFKAVFIGTGAGLPSFMGIFRKRIPYKNKSYESVQKRIRHTCKTQQKRCRSRRRKRCYGRSQMCKTSWCGKRLYCIQTFRRRNACQKRRNTSC